MSQIVERDAAAVASRKTKNQIHVESATTIYKSNENLAPINIKAPPAPDLNMIKVNNFDFGLENPKKTNPEFNIAPTLAIQNNLKYRMRHYQ